MGANTKIEWCHHTWNPWRGCTKVSAGCKNCYADTLSKRNPGTLGVWGPNGSRVVAAESYWRQPLKWDRDAAAAGERHRVFCASLADVFEGRKTMPTDALAAVRAARVRLFDLIRMTPHLDWLLLTKRPQNVRNVVEESLILAHGGDPDDENYFVDRDGSFPEGELAAWLNNWTGEDPPANVWIGTSVEDQAAADARIPHLLRCPAAVRFISAEPLLGAIWFRRMVGDETERDWLAGVDRATAQHVAVRPKPIGGKIDWVIVGGESGRHARPMHPAWARSIRNQCAAAGVSFFFKQWGEWWPFDQECYRPKPDWAGHEQTYMVQGGQSVSIYRVGKHAAGRLLDGVEHNGFPTPAEARS